MSPRRTIRTLVLFASLVSAALVAASARAAEPAAFTVTVEGSGRPLLLIPGLSSPPSVWDATVARLGSEYECHRLTLAGFAGAPPIDGELLPAVRRQLADYIRTMELERPVIIGHSLGGFLALWLAATEPQLTGPVVSVDGLPALAAAMNGAASPEETAVQAASMRRSISALTAEQFAEQTRASLAMMITAAEEHERIAAVAVESDPATVGRAMEELLTTDIRPLMARVTSPVLLFAAAAGMPAAMVDEVAVRYGRQVEAVPDHRVVVVPTARHFVMLDAPDLFLDTIEEFLATAGAARTTGEDD